MSELIKAFLVANKGKNIRIFLMSGFQMRGQLVDFDEKVLKVGTSDYGEYKTVYVRHDAISTYVPGEKFR